MRSRQILSELRDLRLDMRAQNERGDALLAEIREEIALSRAQHEDAKTVYRSEIQITREVIRRNEIAFKQGGEMLAELAEEVRAQTRAIFEALDRLNGGTAPA
jgi:hypothetical protein